jgi:2-amino-4-hydroxy-6-hydroxymethyldihydropteridine diphosphokinase
MATAVIALGSNLGERESTLRSALVEMNALPLTRVMRQSRLYEFAPVGGPAGQANFLNAAALLDTQLAPLVLHEHLLQIETRHGRQRGERWTARTLDLDLLLYDEERIDSPILVVPHPRMSFRRFVLEPAAEIAGGMIVPSIDWSIQQLFDHLKTENDRLAIVSPSDVLRTQLCQLLMDRYRAIPFRPALDWNAATMLWPEHDSAWLSFPPGRDGTNIGHAIKIADGPKLTVLHDPGIMGLLTNGRGPTLTLRMAGAADIEREVVAALQSVWPGLG